MIRFFLTRPIFAAVLSAMILTAGLVALPRLPIAQFPQIAPPTIVITANYPGANATQIESEVTTPIEEAVNGAQGLRYISSVSGDDGTATITCTFALDRDINAAAADVLIAVQQANGALPAAVKMTGVTVSKTLGSFLLVASLYSDNDRYDPIFMSNYASLQVIDPLKRVSGVGTIAIFGQRTYAMRLWLDPKKLADNGLTASDVVTALQAQNVQVPAGAFGQEPSSSGQPYYMSIVPNGQLADAGAFDKLILKSTADGGYVRLSDVGYAQLGAQNYTSVTSRNGQQTIGLAVQQLPGGNALAVSKGVIDRMNVLAERFPPGLHWSMTYNTTDFVSASISEVVTTLAIAIVLVVIVIYLFLQDWRTTLVPLITIPISLIGTFALMGVFGFSINTLTLFGLTLATGLVVDDAIVVIENIARFIQEGKGERSNLDYAAEAMREISGAVVATSLVLLAVFVPVGFFPGTTGELYKQFALTIACSVSISLFVALTLTPTLSLRLLRPNPRKPGGLFRPINAAIDGIRAGYRRVLPTLTAGRRIVAVVFLVFVGATAFLYKTIPSGFLPDEDLGYFFVTLQMPQGTTLPQERAKAEQIDAIMSKIPGMLIVFDIGGRGLGGSGNGGNVGFIVGRLKPWDERKAPGEHLSSILATLQPKLAAIPNAQIFAFSPPAVQGIGSVGGFQFELEDPTNVGLPSLSREATRLIAAANASGNVLRANTTFTNDAPHTIVDVDRSKVVSSGLSLSDVFSAMQVYLGSQYVNDFAYNNRAYQVYVQAQSSYRMTPADLDRIFVRNAKTGAITPVSTYVHLHQQTSPSVITHYNINRNIEITGQTPPGKGSGEALAEMQRLDANGKFPFEWSGISLEQVQGGGASVALFALGLLFVFFVLAAQYESLIDPLVILLSIPLALFGALLFLRVTGIASDVYAQVGYVMLIGLAAKNAILIVEFANQLRKEGHSAEEAVQIAAQTRLRPILMTSFAFILGIFPLVIATGAGAASRHSLGTAVFGGMLISTVLNLFIVPPLYLIAARFDRQGDASHAVSSAPAATR